MVALNPVKEEVAQRISAKMKVPKTIFSSRVIAPMAVNSFLANAGASGVWVNSGGQTL